MIYSASNTGDIILLRRKCAEAFARRDYRVVDTCAAEILKSDDDQRSADRAYAMFYKCASELFTGRASEGYIHLNEASRLAEELHNDSLSGMTLNCMGVYEASVNANYYLAQHYLLKSLKYPGVFYQNKNISSNEYYNPKYVNGSDQWNNSISSHLDYYYSSREDSGVSETTDGSMIREETARYDLQGNRLSAPVKGINIVVYSDGTSKKVMV